jgi:hypothetical protein
MEPSVASSTSSKDRVYGSSQLQPHAQQLPIVPPSNTMQPTPTRAGVHRVLGYRSRSSSKTKSPSPYRRRHPTTTISALNIDGTYDDDNMRDVLMQSIEPVSPTETGYAQDQYIKREDTPYPNGSSISNIADIKVGTDYSFELALPLSIEWAGHDDISCEQLECLDRRPVEYLILAAIGTPQTPEQIQALFSPRVCIDPDANIVDRFVTDCSKTSGRVYDRLFRREVPRIIPYAGSSSARPISGQVFDVYTGEIRKRCLFDDLRDANARAEGRLEIIEDERDLDYDEAPDYRSSESSSAEEDNDDPYDYRR